MTGDVDKDLEEAQKEVSLQACLLLGFVAPAVILTHPSCIALLCCCQLAKQQEVNAGLKQEVVKTTKTATSKVLRSPTPVLGF